MTKKKATAKKPKGNQFEAAKPGEILCQDCAKKGIRTVMTRRSPDTLECNKCNAWCEDPHFRETKDAKRRRLEAELEALDE